MLLNVISNGFYAATKRKTETKAGVLRPKEKLLNPFFTTKPAGEGTGLGLSISHDIIVKQHSGSIEIKSQPGEFTEVRIVLPRAGAFAK